MIPAEECERGRLGLPNNNPRARREPLAWHSRGSMRSSVSQPPVSAIANPPETAMSRCLCFIALVLLTLVPPSWAQEADGTRVSDPTQQNPKLKRLAPDHDVWIDPEKREMHIAGFVCLNEGELEMLVTLEGGKTHESIVAVRSNAYIIHAGLLALGAETGRPATFQPEFQPVTGTEIAVEFEWIDAAGKPQRVRGQDWVRKIRTQTVLEQPFLFGGSMLRREPNGQIQYDAEQGDVVCVSNFPSAMIDVPVESSAEAAELMFEAFKERIPPLLTPVTVILRPVLEQPEAAPEPPAPPAAPSETPDTATPPESPAPPEPAEPSEPTAPEPTDEDAPEETAPPAEPADQTAPEADTEE